MDEKETFSQWAIVEVFGHNVFAGYVSERTIGGAALIQVDDQHPAFTKLFGAAAIYSITPTTEAHAREAAAQIRVRPVTLYILPEPKRLMGVHGSTGYEVDPDEEYNRRQDDYDSDYGDENEEEDEVTF